MYLSWESIGFASRGSGVRVPPSPLKRMKSLLLIILNFFPIWGGSVSPETPQQNNKTVFSISYASSGIRSISIRKGFFISRQASVIFGLNSITYHKQTFNFSSLQLNYEKRFRDNAFFTLKVYFMMPISKDLRRNALLFKGGMQ